MISLLFDKEINNILSPEEVIFTQLCINDFFSDNELMIGYCDEFLYSSACNKLFEYYIDEMPYGTAKARTGSPDIWILTKLRERAG